MERGELWQCRFLLFPPRPLEYAQELSGPVYISQGQKGERYTGSLASQWSSVGVQLIFKVERSFQTRPKRRPVSVLISMLKTSFLPQTRKDSHQCQDQTGKDSHHAETRQGRTATHAGHETQELAGLEEGAEQRRKRRVVFEQGRGHSRNAQGCSMG